jgi:hypothetical protein
MRRSVRTVVAAFVLAVAVPAVAQVGDAVVVVDAPVYVLPDETRTPLRTLIASTVVHVLAAGDDWYRVEFPDRQFGPRVGFMRPKFLRARSSEALTERSPSLEPMRQPTSTEIVPSPPEQQLPPAQTPALATQSKTGSSIARAFYVHVGGGGTHSKVADGGAFVTGVGVQLGRLWANFTPADVTMYPGDTGPYYRDYFDNGQSRCRDSRNGQFADDLNCVAIDVKYAYSVDALLMLPGTSGRTPVFVGAGRRFARDGFDQWFGSAGVAWIPVQSRLIVIARGNFGDSYASALFSVGVTVARK